jgi:putative nucleotidyltransferase with HDIG domain
LITLFQQPDREIDDVAELMREDPSLTAGVLRHANSASSLPDQPIVDVFDAITWVGFSHVYQAILAKFASQSLRLPKGVCGINVDELWHHSAIAAVHAAAIARRVEENETVAFTAGLLHDVGKIILSMAEGQAYNLMITKAGVDGSSLQAAEKRHFGFDHAEIGAHLLRRWGLPAEISEPVLHHHDIDWDQPSALTCALVCLGNIMAHDFEAEFPVKRYEPTRALSAMRLLQLEEGDVVSLLKVAQKDLKHMSGLLDDRA